MLQDVLSGFLKTPKELPPKYFYDERGAELFDAICDTPEYYPTRAEASILEQHAVDIIALSGADTLVELGSGAARKTRMLLDALAATTESPVFAPIDISGEMLIRSSRALLDDYPTLRIDGAIADYDAGITVVPRAGKRLIAFLGSTIGNFRQPDAVAFFRAMAETMDAADHVLIGFDLAKPAGVLNAAYNDAAGVTAEFNLNVLRVLNRVLDADFDVAQFVHHARYHEAAGQIEMYLESRQAQRVRIGALNKQFEFGAGERIRTEISRKFTRPQINAMFSGAGLAERHWYQDSEGRFALVVAGLDSL